MTLPEPGATGGTRPVGVPLASERSGVVVAWCAAMLLGVLATYLPPGIANGNFRFDSYDYEALHRRRVQFAIDSISAAGSLPGWYPREQLGSPFWSNIQNFPFVPTRLALLPAGAANLYSCAILLSALLAAFFTFLYARSIGQRAFPAAVAGWTFAAAGFFASRVLAGHLHLLEAYPALPLLFWLVERCVVKPAHAARAVGWKQLLPLGLCAACVALCGHPQLPVYSLVIAGLYAFWRLRGTTRVRATAGLVFGAGCGAFALWPMFLLVGRSTRAIADLAPSTNDIALPYGRLLGAFFLPWRDGWPAFVPRTPPTPFHGYPTHAYFWDTFNYIGLLPWIALVGLIASCIARRRKPRGAVAFIVLMAIVALAAALPWLQAITRTLPGTLLRAPCRLTYPVTLALALATGGGVQAVCCWLRGRWACALVALPLAYHVVDLTGTSRQFLVPSVTAAALDGKNDDWLAPLVGDGRVAYDNTLNTLSNRRFDDIGFYDSIQMERSYEMIMALGNVRRGRYLEDLGGDVLPARALAACGVRIIIGYGSRRDVSLVATPQGIPVYRVQGASPRVAFLPTAAIQFVPSREILPRLGPAAAELAGRVLLSDDARPLFVDDSLPATRSAAARPDAAVALEYHRNTPDAFRIRIDAPTAGIVRVIETFDPGWSATLDGSAAPVLAANYGMMAIPTPAGRHELLLTFTTPGRGAGALISLLSLLALLSVSFIRPAPSLG